MAKYAVSQQKKLYRLFNISDDSIKRYNEIKKFKAFNSEINMVMFMALDRDLAKIYMINRILKNI